MRKSIVWRFGEGCLNIAVEKSGPKLCHESREFSTLDAMSHDIFMVAIRALLVWNLGKWCYQSGSKPESVGYFDSFTLPVDTFLSIGQYAWPI